MPASILPRYPIYIPSKGRANKCFTAQFLMADGVSFRLVVEETEQDDYANRFGAERLLVLPFKDQGSVIPTRNWIKAHSAEEGYERHWQLDDNIRHIMRWNDGWRIRCEAGPAIAAVEDFTDRYENVAISGMNYVMFGVGPAKPFILNCRVYSCSLILNSIPHEWRGRYNEDADICLQVLADGWCTVLVNAFLVKKIKTMVIKGGNTDEIYQGDGRAKMARSLERMWPGVVKTKRRFGRPQHHIFDGWKRFDTPLKLKPEVDLSKMPAVDDYGLKLKQVAPKVRSKELKKLLRKNG